MRIILSPAKKMRIDEEAPGLSAPSLLEKTAVLEKYLRALSFDEAKALWKCSDKLVQENLKRIEVMDLHHRLTAALFAYDGLVFQHIGASKGRIEVEEDEVELAVCSTAEALHVVRVRYPVGWSHVALQCHVVHVFVDVQEVADDVLRLVARHAVADVVVYDAVAFLVEPRELALLEVALRKPVPPDGRTTTPSRPRSPESGELPASCQV